MFLKTPQMFCEEPCEHIIFCSTGHCLICIIELISHICIPSPSGATMRSTHVHCDSGGIQFQNGSIGHKWHSNPSERSVFISSPLFTLKQHHLLCRLHSSQACILWSQFCHIINCKSFVFFKYTVLSTIVRRYSFP